MMDLLQVDYVCPCRTSVIAVLVLVAVSTAQPSPDDNIVPVKAY
jgi:hypothetical protein